MKLTCVRSNHEITSRIIGNDQAAFTDLVEQLANHVKARFPEEMKELALMGHVAIAYMLLLKADWDDSETFIQQIWDEHQTKLFEYMEIDEVIKEAGEEDSLEAYDIGFEDCRKQIVAFIKARAPKMVTATGLDPNGGTLTIGVDSASMYNELAKEIEEMPVEEESEPAPVGVDTPPAA